MRDYKNPLSPRCAHLTFTGCDYRQHLLQLGSQTLGLICKLRYTRPHRYRLDTPASRRYGVLFHPFGTKSKPNRIYYYTGEILTAVN